MREAKPEWLQVLRSECGPTANLFFMEEVSRWCFMLPGGDGVPRAQFWGVYTQPVDPSTGLHPFRELDDANFREAMLNLRKTFVGNTKLAVQEAIDFNTALFKKGHRAMGNLFADMIHEKRRAIIRSTEGRNSACPVIPVGAIDFGKGVA